jgi:uncharacterized protein (DUF1778 family)
MAKPKKSQQIHIFLTTAEKAQISQAAEKDDRTISMFVRLAALEKCKEQTNA